MTLKTINSSNSVSKMENQNESHIFSIFTYDTKQRYLTSNAKDTDYFLILPVEIIVKIFSFLPILELRTCAVVSKYWNALSSSAILWLNIRLKGISIKIQLLERILNSNVRQIRFDGVKIIESENLVPPFLKTSRFDSLQVILFWGSIKLEVLEEILSLSPKLRHLELRFFFDTDIGSNFFRQIIKLRFLEKLVFFCLGIKNILEVAEILRNAKKFENLKDTFFLPHFNNKRESEQFYESFLGQCPNLEILAIPEQHINESAFSYILRMKNLKELNISNLIFPSNVPLSHMRNSEKWINLQGINICGIHNPGNVLTLLQLSPNLEALSVGGTITYSLFERILTYKNLKKLHFIDVDLTALNGLERFKTFNELRILKLYNFHSSELPELEARILSKVFLRCEKLTELFVDKFVIDENLFRQILEMDNLEKLEVARPKFPSQFCEDGKLGNYRKFKRLKYLLLVCGESEHSVSNAEIILGCCKNLTDLTMNITSEIIWNCIFSMIELERLHLTSLMPDEFNTILNNIDTLPKFSKLKYLHIFYWTFNSNLQRIEALLSLCDNVEDLSLSKIYLTDNICRSIAAMKDLKRLNFVSVSGISDEKIKVILNGCLSLIRDKFKIHTYNKEGNDNSDCEESNC